jgi:hypothetical protein
MILSSLCESLSYERGPWGAAVKWTGKLLRLHAAPTRSSREGAVRRAAPHDRGPTSKKARVDCSRCGPSPVQSGATAHHSVKDRARGQGQARRADLAPAARGAVQVALGGIVLARVTGAHGIVRTGLAQGVGACPCFAQL